MGAQSLAPWGQDGRVARGCSRAPRRRGGGRGGRRRRCSGGARRSAGRSPRRSPRRGRTTSSGRCRRRAARRSCPARRSRRARARGGRCRSGSRSGRRPPRARRARRRAGAWCRRSCGRAGRTATTSARSRAFAPASAQLAGELRAPVGRARPGRRVLGVRLARRAVEDVVGGDVHDVHTAACGEVARAGAVDGGRARLVGLGAVDVGPGGAVDHRVRARVADGAAHGVGVGDVQVGPGQGDDLVAGVPCGRHHVAAEHARGPRYQEAHGGHE